MGGMEKSLSRRNSETSSSTLRTATIIENNDDDENATTTNESAESLLAQELNKLSFRERESISMEIHGIVGTQTNETPERINAALSDLQSELNMLCTLGVAPAFARSQKLYGTIINNDSDPEQQSYLNSRDLRLMFLRSELFDCHKAAIRLCHFADLVHDSHGDLGLQRRIKLSDIPASEVAIMKWGRCQVLPYKDRAGRRIYIKFFSNEFSKLPTLTKFRIILWYAMSMVQDDVDCQKRGIVLLWWMHGCHITMDEFLKIAPGRGKLSRGIPARVGAMHVLFPPGDNNSIEQRSTDSFALGKVVSELAQNYKPHMRMHRGSPAECFRILETFGIPTYQIPLDIVTGKVHLSNNDRYLESRATKEEQQEQLQQQDDPKSSSTSITIEQSTNSTIIKCLRDTDILMGRGRTIMKHPGNIFFRNFVDAKLDTYAIMSSRRDTFDWTKGVLDHFQQDVGVRFLKQADNDGKSYVEVSNEVARSKIRTTFRDARKQKIKNSINKPTKPLH